MGTCCSDTVLVLWNRRETSVWMSGDCQDGPKEDASLVRKNWGFSGWKNPTRVNKSRGGHLYLLAETIKQRAQQ